MILLHSSVDCFMWVPALLRRVKHSLPISAGDRGINYNSVRVARGVWTSTVTVTAEDKAGVPFPWSGKEFRGESTEVKRVQAEHAAARLFLEDPDVRYTAANLDAAYGKQGSDYGRHAHKIRVKRHRAANRLRGQLE